MNYKWKLQWSMTSIPVVVAMITGLVASVSLSVTACKPRSKSNLASAEEKNPYSFGGACQTSGRWTDAARQQANAIKKAIEGLANNEKCTQMLANVAALDLSLPDGQDDKNPNASVARVFSLGREINSLRQYQRMKSAYAAVQPSNLSVGGGVKDAYYSPEVAVPFKPEYTVNVDRLMTDRMFEYIGVQANRDETAIEAPVDPTKNEPQMRSALVEAGQVVDDVMFFRQRMMRSAAAGLDVATTVFDNLANDQSCLMGRTSEIATIAVAGAKLLGSYVGADAGLAAKSGNAIASYFKYLSKQKFNFALNGINDMEFIMSITCLMETTTATYCSVRDASYMAKDLVQTFGIAKPVVSEAVFKGPKTASVEVTPDMRTGYMILNQSVPKVAEWLRKVVTGVTPRRATDATYYNSVMGSLNGLQQVQTDVQTALEQAIHDFPKDADDVAKKKWVYTTAEKIRGFFAATVQRVDSANSGTIPDFYELASPPNRQLFEILGIPMPEVCDINLTERQKVLTPEEYLEASGNYTPIGDARSRLNEMRQNVDIVAKKMLSLVTAYVRNNLNIDQAMVGAEFAEPSVTRNPLQAMQEVRTYLMGLVKRINNLIKTNQATSQDKNYILLFMDTIVRINSVLDAERALLDDVDQRIKNGDVDQFIKDQENYQDIRLALDGETTTIQRMQQKVAKFTDRYKSESLWNAFNFNIPGDEKVAAVRLAEQAAINEIAMEETKKAIHPDNPVRQTAKVRDPIGIDLSKNKFLLDAAYDQFDMLRFRETFFINRVATAVHWDLAKQLVQMQAEVDAAKASAARGDIRALKAANSKWSPITRQVLIMADKFIVERVNGIAPTLDLQLAALDRAKAQSINFENINALTLFQDTLTRHISHLESRINGRVRQSQMDRDLLTNTMWNPMRAIRKGLASKNIQVAGRMGLIADPYMSIEMEFDSNIWRFARWVRPDLYWSPFSWTDKVHFGEDEFSSLATLRGLLCMQTLALPDPRPYREVCKGAYLQSVYEPNTKTDPDAGKTEDQKNASAAQRLANLDALSLSYDDWMRGYELWANGRESSGITKTTFQGRRICAVYDHLRNGNVHQMRMRNMADRELLQTMQSNLNQGK